MGLLLAFSLLPRSTLFLLRPQVDPRLRTRPKESRNTLLRTYRNRNEHIDALPQISCHQSAHY